LLLLQLVEQGHELLDLFVLVDLLVAQPLSLELLFQGPNLVTHGSYPLCNAGGAASLLTYSGHYH